MRFLNPADYQPECERLFSEMAKKIREVLPKARIEHVGASSIEGAISKGDLDICVIVPLNGFGHSLGTLQNLGLAEKEGTLQNGELRMLVPNDGGDYAVQLVSAGSKYEFFIRFRDMLRASKELVREYNDIKRQAGALGEADYRKAKSSFIERVLER